MAENSKIEWTDHTVNFWWGCAKVSPACAHCYAEGQAARFYPGLWGADGARRVRLEDATKEAMRYERQAIQGVIKCPRCGWTANQNAKVGSALCVNCLEGILRSFPRPRVFTNSMADFFEDRRDLDAARLEALDVIQQTPHLDWLILTKRPENILPALQEAQRRALDGDMGFAYTTPGTNALSEWLGWWLCGKAPANVWLGTTVEDQERANQRIPALLQVPAAVRFLSCEPLLGPVNLSLIEHGAHVFDALRGGGFHETHLEPLPAPGRLDWVICGGESGRQARPMHPDWARSLRDQCAAAGVPFLFKQWGEHAPNWLNDDYGREIPGTMWMDRMGKKAAGRLLDGRQHDGYPEVR